LLLTSVIVIDQCYCYWPVLLLLTSVIVIDQCYHTINSLKKNFNLIS